MSFGPPTPSTTKQSSPQADLIQAKRPLLVWFLYVCHLCLVPWIIWYIGAVLHLVNVDESMAAALAQHSPLSKLSSVITISLLVVGAHKLFFRQRGALAIYLLAPGVYLFQNVLIFSKYCLHYSCPSVSFFVPVATNCSVMLVASFIVFLCLKRWPPQATASRET